MKDEHKTKQQLVAELTELRQRITKLAAVETEHRRAEEALQKANDELELWVEERTIELTAANEQLEQKIAEHEQAEKALERHNRALQALHEVTLDIGAEWRMSALLRDIMERAAGLLDADRGGGIYLYDADENVLRLVEGTGINKGRAGAVVQVHEGMAGRVFRTSQPFIIDDYTHWAERAIVLAADPPSVVMGVPLLLQGQVIGVLGLVANSHRRTFSQQDVQLAEMFAAQATVAIQNARLSEQAQQEIVERKQAEEVLQKRTEEIELLYEAGRQISQTLNSETIHRQLYAWVANSLGCDGLFISSYDSEEELIRCDFAITEGNQLDTSQFPPIPLEPEGQGTQSVVIRTGEPMLIRDYQARIETTTTVYQVDEKGTVVGRDQVPRDEEVTRSALIIPVKLEGEVAGVIQIMSYRLDAYTESDMRIVESLASQIAVAGNNALLYQQAQDEITQRKQAEKELSEHRDHLEELVAERTAELDRRVAEVEQLNRGMSNLLEDLQVASERTSKMARQLKVTNKELESFTYSVSHDLRAPLRHVDSFAQLLLEQEAARLEPSSARYLQNIVAATDKMRQLIDDLLALSRTGRAEMHLRPVAPNEIIEKARKELAPALAGRRITWEIAPLPAVQADPGLLRVVWDNLLSNAVKYTGTRPEARIEIGATPPDEKGRVTFFIRDNGVGFDPRYTHKLFGTFQRLHRDEEFEGSGIGLATVRRIIHRHGGRVWAEGETDHGATFYFTLSALID